jgi:glucose uptake protein
MYQPEAYVLALCFMVASMVCWGSWANTMKLAPKFSFQLFYWDYVFGVIAASLLWGLTMGSLYGGDSSFLPNLKQASSSRCLYALAGGIVFNLGNLLLVAAIEIAGLAVAFPVGIGMALVVGVVLSYIISPAGNVFLLGGGVLLVVVAIVLDALAYRRRELGRPRTSARGIQLSILCGVLMGFFYPLVAKAMTGPTSLGPYAVVFVFALGVGICALPVNYLLMKKPLTETKILAFADYRQARPIWHLWGALGGIIWCTGMVLNIVASHAQIIGPAISYAIGQGATMISAIWGVFIWREFADAPPASQRLILPMFICFAIGLAAIAIAPLASQ